MRVQVKVRSASLQIECGSAGANRVLWLADQAKQRYAGIHDLDPESLIAIDAFNQDGHPAWPHDLIADCIKPSDIVTVVVRDTVQASPADSSGVTLWERFADSEPKDYVPVLLVLDLRQFADSGTYDETESLFRQKEDDENDAIDSGVKFDKPLHHNADGKKQTTAAVALATAPKPLDVSVIGNFTKWRSSVPMTESDTPNLFSVQVRIPPAAALLFRFSVDDRWVVSEAHPIMMDSKGLRLNVVNVPGRKQKEEGDADRLFKLVSMPALDLTLLGDQALGQFAKMQLETQSERRRIFNLDWTGMHITELVTNAETYRALKDAMWSHFPLVSRIFQAFASSKSSSSNSSDRLSNMQLWVLCQKCQIPSPNLPLHQITEFFYPYHIIADGKMPDFDCNHPDHQLLRHQFFEGIIRLAMNKYPRISPAHALNIFFSFHLNPHALRPEPPNSVRTWIAEEAVQTTYSQFDRELRDLFERYSARKEQATVKRYTMGFGEFKRMLVDHGVKTDGRAGKQAVMLFLRLQGDPETEDNPENEIVFREFLEALALLADIRYREKLPLHCKLQRLLNDVFAGDAITQITSP